MKKLILSLLVVNLLFSCSEQNQVKEEEKIELGEAYGPVEVDVTKAISVEEFFRDFEQKDGPEEYTIEGKIVTICAKAGCWVGIDDGNDDYFMVRFKDHFTLPLDTKLDQTAYFHGVAIWDSIPVEKLREEAMIEGKTKEEAAQITEPKYIFSFEADGIVLTK
ncbi:MAG TPA: DUF4920 domain-containing protein [Taishania sp.]|nr:DUF4920 domain-containing protein [Taishania sp.]